MIIETKALSVGYTDKILYEDVDLCLEPGRITVLLGMNGSGKSSLLKTICGFTPPLSGGIFVEGKALEMYSKRDLSTIVSVVLTDRVQDGGLRVKEIVSMGRHPYTGFFGKLTKRDTDIVERSMREVGIMHMSNAYISELSDGERQKVMIAKSLAQESKIIILDEPTSFLDFRSRLDIMNLLHKLSRDKGRTFLLSLHDMELSLQYADNLWILKRGKKIISGQTERIILNGMLDDVSGDGYIFDIDKGEFVSRQSQGTPIRYEGQDLIWIKNILRREGYYIDNASSETFIKVNSYDEINFNGQHCSSLEDFIKLISI